MDTFSLAAAGDPAAQEVMAHVAITNYADLNSAPDVELWVAHLWANIALVNGNLAVRWFRVRLLLVLAPRCQPHAPERAKALVTDAVAMLLELSAEGDAEAAAMLPRVLASVSEDYGRYGHDQIGEAARGLAAARAAALFSTAGAKPAGDRPADAITIH